MCNQGLIDLLRVAVATEETVMVNSVEFWAATMVSAESAATRAVAERIMMLVVGSGGV